MSLPDTASGNGTAAPPSDPSSGCDVTMPSGATFEVMNDEEAQYIAERVDRYQTAYRLSDISDQQDLDQIIIGELLNQRWSQWLALGTDYEDEPVDEARIRKDRIENSRELRLLKKSMGMDKLAREKNRGEGSLAKYIENLLIRAKQFGYHRNMQAAKAIDLLNEMFGLVTFHFNCSPEEQAEMGATAGDILAWLRDVAEPEWKALDADFRTHQQMWIRDQ